MSKQTLKKLPRTYFFLWLAIIAAYMSWLAFFLKHDTYAPSETGISGAASYAAWAVLSTTILLVFPLCIKVFLYGSPPGKLIRIFCLSSLALGFAYVTWYCFLKDPFEYTASMIGLDYPLHFKLWGIISSVSIFLNVLYMYRINGYHSRSGVICGSLGSAAIFVTINVPSAGEKLILNSLRCMSHWAGALLFAFLLAFSIVVFLAGKARQGNRRYIALLVSFLFILITMLVLLVAVGKNGIIEGLPTWAAYLLLFLVNFTDVFKENGKPHEKEEVPAKTKSAEKTMSLK
jgi:hypothetical protein